jgi:hypothetical protein
MGTLPPSKVSDYQDDIMYPEGVYESVPVDAFPGIEETRLHTGKYPQDDPMTMVSSQIWLCVFMSKARNALYATSKKYPPNLQELKTILIIPRWVSRF